MAHTKVTKTYSQNTGAANTFSYSGSFDVFKETEVEVELDNVALTYTASTINESASPREYTVDTTAKTIHIGGADLSSGTIVIEPVTDMGAPTPRATYTPGASITADDLNNNQKQLMRKAMEYDEQKLSSRGGTMTGHLTIGEDQTIIFEGATDDAYETTLTVTDPTADRTITLPNVTGTVVTTGDSGTVATGMIAGDAITAAKIADDVVNSEHYAAGSIDTEHIADLNVTTAKIANDAITGAKIADDAIDSEHYATGSIDEQHLATNSVTQTKIGADAVIGSKIADNAIDSEHYTDGSIEHAHLATDCIQSDNIADDQIDSEHYVTGSIDTAHIADSQITHAKLAGDCVQSDNIADDQINSEHYVDGSIDTAHIADSQITHAKLANDCVDGDNIADDSVDSEHLVADSIDAEHYAAASVDATALASNAVTTAKITDSNVTTAKVADDAITIAKVGCEQTTISDSDSHIPTSGAVVDYVAAQIAPIGGLEVIADEDNFPSTQPDSGVVISISDAAGIVVQDGSGGTTAGRSTTARTAGNGSDNVTINNFPSSLHGETLASGVGLMVSSTGSSNTYNYHKILAAETDVKQLSDDINDFNARYRVHAGEPSSNNDEGDLVFDSNANKMKVYDGSAWGEVTSTGDFKFLVAVDAGTTTAATYDGSDTSFDLKETSTSGSAASVTNINQLIVSLNGVIQKPNTGSYSASEEGFYLTDADTIRFCTAPPSGSTSFIIQCGSAVSIPTPGDGTVSAAKIASGAVTTAKLADSNVTVAKMAANSVDSDQYVDGSIDLAHMSANSVDSDQYVDGSIDHVHLAADAVDGDNIADDSINSEHYVDGSIDTAHIADDQVTQAKIANNAVGLDELAGIARGKIIYGDASGNPAVLAVGSANQVLTADGTDISWAAAAGGGVHNIMINGAFQIAQRGTSSTSTGYTTVDRWKDSITGQDEQPTRAQISLSSSDTGPWAKGFRNAWQITNGNQSSGAGAGDKYFLEYRFEGQDIAQSGWDYTSASSYATLSFWVKSSVAQDFQGYLLTLDGTNYKYPFSTGSLSANTWTKITKTIPGNSNLQIDNDTGAGFLIVLAPFIGTDFTASVTDNAWSSYSSSARTNASATGWWTTNDSTFAVTGFQFEIGSTANEFQHRSYGDELLKCQRYFYVLAQGRDDGERPISLMVYENGSRVTTIVRHPVRPRVTPTLTAANATNAFVIRRSDGSDNFDTITQRYADYEATELTQGSDVSGSDLHPGMFRTTTSASYIHMSMEL